jgi:hypothetical protein
MEFSPRERNLTLEERAALGTRLAALLPVDVHEAFEMRARRHRQAALEALAAANPNDPAEIMGLQVEVRKVEAAMMWIEEIFTDARMAVDDLQQEGFTD